MNSPQKSNLKKREVIVNLLKEILYNSLAQAILKIALTPYVILKAILLVFVLAAVGFVSYLIIQTMLTFLEYNVSTTSRTIYEMPTLFPKVTFCNLNDFTTEYAYNLTQTGIFDGEFLPVNERKMIVHDLDDILIGCLFNNVRCNSTNFAWSYDAVYGSCYTFNSGGTSSDVGLKKSNIAGPDCGLYLVLYVNVYEKLLLMQDFIRNLGLIVRIANSTHTAYNMNDGILVAPGTHTYISISREFKSMLPKPYSSCETTTLPSNSYLYTLISRSEFVYTQQFCFAQCLQEYYFIKNYNCTYHLMPSLYNTSQCPHDTFEKILDEDSIFESTEYISETCLPLCPLECNQTLYKYSLSFSQLHGGDFVSTIKNNSHLTSDFINRPIDSTQAEKSFIRLNIFYDSLSYTLTTESPQMDWVTLLGSIGGNLGLFLGVSVFSFCELVEVLVEIYYILIDKEKATGIKPINY